MADLKEAGAIGVSDDGVCVMNAAVMRRALEYAKTFDLLVSQHCEDHHLTAKADMHEGARQHAPRAARLAARGRRHHRRARPAAHRGRGRRALPRGAHLEHGRGAPDPRGQVARAGRHGRGHAAPSDAHRRGAARLRHLLQGQPTHSQRRRPRGADRSRSRTAPSTASPPTTRRTARSRKTASSPRRPTASTASRPRSPRCLPLVRRGDLSATRLIEALVHRAGQSRRASRAARSKSGARADLVLLDPERRWTITQGSATFALTQHPALEPRGRRQRADDRRRGGRSCGERSTQCARAEARERTA